MSTAKCPILDHNTMILSNHTNGGKGSSYDKLLETTDIWKRHGIICLFISIMYQSWQKLPACLCCVWHTPSIPFFKRGRGNISHQVRTYVGSQQLLFGSHLIHEVCKVDNQESTGGHYNADMNCYLFFGSFSFAVLILEKVISCHNVATSHGP